MTLGLVVESRYPVADLEALAADAERLGLDELWYSEVAAGGVAGVAAALLGTRRLVVGTGVVALALRHPAQLAMEVATLAALRPGRLRVGVGLGVPDWMRRLGALPRSPLTAVGEALGVMRRLLDGEEVTFAGRTCALDGVRLDHPAPGAVPLDLAAVGPRMLELAGAVADGAILSVLCTPGYVRWARQRVAAGQRAAGRAGAPLRVTAFALLSVDASAEAARANAREHLAEHLSWGANAITDHYGISDEVRALLARGGRAGLLDAMPDRWIDDLVIAGDPARCRAGVDRLLDAGADAVALLPAGGDARTMLELVAGGQAIPTR